MTTRQDMVTGLSASKLCRILAATHGDNMATADHFLLHLGNAHDAVQVQRLVALEVVLKVPAREANMVDSHHARSALLAAELRAGVIARRASSRAGPRAQIRRMHSWRVALGLTLVSASFQPPFTRQRASALGRQLEKVLWMRTLYRRILVSWTAEVESASDGISLLKSSAHIHPHRDIRVRVGASNEIHAVLGSAEQNVNAVRRPEEADLSLGIAPDQGHDDDLGLFTLEVVDCGQSKTLQKSLLLQQWSTLAAMLLVETSLEAICGEHILVAITDRDVKVLVQCVAELMQLARIRRENSDICPLVDALADDVSNQRLGHSDLPHIAVGLHVSIICGAVLDMRVVQPKDIVPHSDHVREIRHASVILKTGIYGMDEL